MHSRVAEMNTSRIRFVILVLLGWLCFAVGLADWCHNASAVGVAAIAWALTGVALIACWKVGPIKAWALNVDIRWLVIFHVTRMIAGIYFLALCHRGELPCAFALAAGWGDILVALLALVAVATMCTD